MTKVYYFKIYSFFNLQADILHYDFYNGRNRASDNRSGKDTSSNMNGDQNIKKYPKQFNDYNIFSKHLD